MLIRCWMASSILLLASAVLLAAPPVPPPEVLSDASLCDILFLDPDRGFAVGERGAIWRTEDGGRHWRLVPSPVGCRWESIYFVDAERGWIVGGAPQQVTHQSQGAVLRTLDGGRTWKQVPKLVLPALKQVKFFDAKQGVAVGHASEFAPAGIFRTSDGGQTWAPQPGKSLVGWESAAFLAPQRGVIAGDGAHVALVSGTELLPVKMPNVGARTVRKIALADERQAWLAGDGGLVLTSDSGGAGWTLPRGAIPEAALAHLDLQAVAARGPHVWFAGSPGSVILHSHDGGAHWELSKTECTAPLMALHFLDEQRGWAAGALGTILATRDGGRTWTVQRRGGERAALLMLLSQASSIPLEALTRASGDEGFLSAVEILTRPVAPPRHGHVPLAERTNAAVTQLGASGARTAWRFPTREAELQLAPAEIVRLWNESSGGRGAEELEAHVVRCIRQWRPEVIVTERASVRGDDPLAHIVNQIVLASVAHAADPQAYPQLAEIGLAPWRTKKIFSTLPADTKGMTTISTAQIAPRLGASLADATVASRGLLECEHRLAPQQLGFSLIQTSITRELAARDLFSGVHLPAGSDARRTLSEISPTALQTLSRQAQKAKNVRELMARGAADGEGGGSWLGQVDDLTQGLSRAAAAQTLYDLGWRYHYAGQWEAAAETFARLVERYGDEELAAPAQLYLVQVYASGEAAARLRGGVKFVEGKIASGERPTAIEPAALQLTPVAESPALNMQAHLTTPVTSGAAQRAHRAAEAAQVLAQRQPTLAARPEAKFPLAAAQRQIGLVQQAEAAHRSFVQDRVPDAWWNCAAAEQWLLRPRLETPKPVATVKRIGTKPKLDGALDEVAWQSAAPLELAAGAGEAPLPGGSLRLAHDGEFLYVAIVCEKIAGFDYSLTDDTRTHDSDISLHDRVEICLDLDRDYCTYYRLGIDYRGFTRDESLGDKTWNPTWYVAAEQDAATWRIEAAIPLNELHVRPPQPRETWALGVTRILPGHGLTSWHKPAACRPLGEGFGLMSWE